MHSWLQVKGTRRRLEDMHKAEVAWVEILGEVKCTPEGGNGGYE